MLIKGTGSAFLLLDALGDNEGKHWMTDCLPDGASVIAFFLCVMLRQEKVKRTYTEGRLKKRRRDSEVDEKKAKRNHKFRYEKGE